MCIILVYQIYGIIMKEYKVKGIVHKVYEVDELPSHITYVDDWRNSNVGDWVLSDDDCVIQVLRRDSMGSKITIGTCTGTFIADNHTKMDTEKNKNIYSVGGKDWYTKLKERKSLTAKEKIFVDLVKKPMFDGLEPYEAYMEAFQCSKDNAKRMSAILLKQKRVIKGMNEKNRDVYKKLSMDREYLIQAAKDMYENSKNDSDKITSLKMLWSGYDIVPKSKTTTQVAGFFQGHTPQQLASAKRPELRESND